MKVDHGNIITLLVTSLIISALAFLGSAVSLSEELGNFAFHRDYDVLFFGGLVSSIIWILMLNYGPLPLSLAGTMAAHRHAFEKRCFGQLF